MRKNWKTIVSVVIGIAWALPLVYACVPVSVYPHPKIVFAYWWTEIGLIVMAAIGYVYMNWKP